MERRKRRFMKQVEYLTKELSKFVTKLDLPSSIITSCSDIEVPFDWGSFYYKANTGEVRIHYKKKQNKQMELLEL